MRDRTASFKALAKIVANLSDEEQLAIIDHPKRFGDLMCQFAAEVASSTYVIPVHDKDVPLPHRAAARTWRQYARAHDYNGPIAWRVKEGFTLRSHAQTAGPCSGLRYISYWDEITGDAPTDKCIVFWVPRLVSSSMDKTFVQMEERREEAKRCLELPDNHATSFGGISLLFALVLAHFKRVGERVPLKEFFAVSDSLGVEGNRLIVGGFNKSGLQCANTVGKPRYDVGFFLLGVELL